MAITTLSALNAASKTESRAFLQICCGAERWVDAAMLARPFADGAALLKAAETIWHGLTIADWHEAFSHHPKIGDIDSLRDKFASTAEMASVEQSGAQSADEKVLTALADGNIAYERRFGYIFIVFATGKSAKEMLSLLESRLGNTDSQEIQIAAEEHNKITQHRLSSLLQLSEEN